jgi:hypothetical protein
MLYRWLASRDRFVLIAPHPRQIRKPPCWGTGNDEPPITPRAPARAGNGGQRYLLLRDNALIFAQLAKAGGVRIRLNRRWLPNSLGSVPPWVSLRG